MSNNDNFILVDGEWIEKNVADKCNDTVKELYAMLVNIWGEPQVIDRVLKTPTGVMLAGAFRNQTLRYIAAPVIIGKQRILMFTINTYTLDVVCEFVTNHPYMKTIGYTNNISKDNIKEFAKRCFELCLDTNVMT